MDLCPNVLYSNLAIDLFKYLPSGTAFMSRDFHGSVHDLYPGIDLKSVYAIQLANSFFKKFVEVKNEKFAKQAALDKFLASNDRCKSYQLNTESMDELDVIIIGEMRQILHDALMPSSDLPARYNMDDIFQHGGVGPGSSVKASGTSYYHKIANGPMTCTADHIYWLYRRYNDREPLSLEGEDNRLKQWGTHLVVQGNTIAFAEKTSLIKRIICTEPLLNMYFQLGLAHCLEDVLQASFGVNLSHQPSINKMLACRGSLTGIDCTIDLVSASDNNSLTMIRENFPLHFVRQLERFRSPTTMLPNGSIRKLHMISSMGNAATFPLQTLLFCSVVKAVYRAYDLPWRRADDIDPNWGVFGDDIIVDRKVYQRVCHILELLGHEVNHDKSFSSGLFRESCGGDYYDGHDVRGIYCKRFSTPQDVYTLYNRLQIWEANSDIPLKATLGYLKGLVYYIPIPPWESEDAGFRVPRFALGNLLKGSASVKAVDLKEPLLDSNESIIYCKYTSLPRTIKLGNVAGRPFVLKRRSNGQQVKLLVPHNHAGILLTALSGRIRDGKLGNRVNAPTRYVRRVAIAPCWDYVNPLLTKFSKAGWLRWVTNDEHSPILWTFPNHQHSQTLIWSDWLPGGTEAERVPERLD